MSTPIPVSVIGGYLGAGKTTLVNHLLRHAAGRRIAVLVNDFGALPIDADLIEAATDDLISIAGGCVCCSFGSDLMAALDTLTRRDPPPEHLVIETSGVALPGGVARSVALVRSFAIDSVAVLCDAETVRARAADRYMGDTITRQLDEADLVILNKTDLVAENKLDPLRRWLADAAPRARLVETSRAAVPPALLFGIAGSASSQAPGLLSAGRIRPAGDAATRYASTHCMPVRPLDVERLARVLTRPACGIVRAKGIVRDRDGSLRTLHVVGKRHEVTPAATDGMETGVVCIGLAGQLDPGVIESAFRELTDSR